MFHVKQKRVPEIGSELHVLGKITHLFKVVFFNQRYMGKAVAHIAGKPGYGTGLPDRWDVNTPNIVSGVVFSVGFAQKKLSKAYVRERKVKLGRAF